MKDELREFRAFLRRMCRRFPSNRAFAMQIGLEPSALSRAMGKSGMAFDVTRCLRIAKATRQNPLVVLRLAKKTEIADLLEQWCATDERVLLSEDAALLQQAFDAIEDRETRAALIRLAQGAAGIPGGARAGGRRHGSRLEQVGDDEVGGGVR